MKKIHPSVVAFFQKKSSLYLMVIVVFVLTLLIRLTFVGLIPLWREDGYHYLAKAEEILQGDFSLKEQDIGLPLFYSLFLLMFGSGDVFEDLYLAQILLAIVESLILIPLFLIVLRFFGRKSALLASLLFTFWPGLIYWTAQGYSEGLFIFLALFSFYFMTASCKNRSFLLLAAIFAGLLFYVRITGIVFLPLIFLFAYVNRREIPRWNGRWLIYILLIFILIVSPYFVMRFSSYQNPFHYSMGSKYLFADNHQQLFDPDFRPSLSSYLSTHSLNDIFSRAWRGIRALIGDAYKANYFLMTLTFIGLLLFTKKKYLSFHFVFLFYFLGLFWIHAVVRSGRFLVPLVPFGIIMGAGVVGQILGRKKRADILMGLVLIFFVFLHWQVFFNLRSGLKYEGSIWEDAKKWGTWIAQNIPEGSFLVIREGIDIVDMLAPHVRVETIPHRRNLEDIWNSLQARGVNYMAIGSGGLEAADWRRIPALREIRTKTMAPFLIRIYSNESLKWSMEIFKINWDKKGTIDIREHKDIVEAESLVTSGISKYDSDSSNEFAVAIKGSASDEKSVLLGPIRGVQPGKYHISFRLKARDFQQDFVVRVDIFLLKMNEVLSKRVIKKDDIKTEDVYENFDFFLDLRAKRDIYFKVTVQGEGEFWIDRVDVLRAD